MIKWLMIAIRTLMMALDIIVYQVVVWMYELFMMIAETGVFSQETIQTFAGRIYALLGIFMLFKVTFSLVNYLFNPDDFTDKTKGASKLLTNFFIVLIGIISVPYIFTAAFNLQTIILKENLIGNLIMGMRPTANSTETSDYIKQGGNNMAYTVFSGFFRPSEKLTSRECSNMPLDVQGGTAQLNSACSSFPVFNEKLNNDKTIGETLVSAYDNRNYHELIDWGLDLATFVYNDEFAIDYTFLISTVAGGFLAWILLIFCIDVAVRSVKLGFLQIIAPIPIISYIDPKSGKDGMFNKWVKNCTSSFADLFIRLVAIYFALFIISAITSGEIIKVTTGEQQTNILVIIFIIFGALLFAKQVPQLISDLTGVKLSGGFTLNPMKKLGESPLAAAAIGGAAGVFGGMAGNFAAHRQLGHGVLRSATSGLGGAFSGAARGMSGGFGTAGKGGSLGAGFGAAGRGGQRILKSEGTTVGGRMAAGVQSKLGIDTQADRYDKEIKEYDNFMKLRSSADSRAEKKVLETDHNGALTAKNQVEYLKGMAGQHDVTLGRTVTASDIAAAEMSYNTILDSAKMDYMATVSDGEIRTYAEAMQRIKVENKNNAAFSSLGDIVDSTGNISGVNIDDSKKKIGAAKSTLENSAAYETSKANKAYGEKKK